MAETETGGSFDELRRLKPVVDQEPEIGPVEPKLDEQGRAYATGRRKDAVARVWVKPGSGKFLVKVENNRLRRKKALRKDDKTDKTENALIKEMSEYFARPTQQLIINQAFQAIRAEGHYDVFCTVSGGGLSGQAGAVRHGLSRALTLFDPSLRGPLKAGGFLTRDDRQVERKKYGRAKARRSFQFSKR